MQSLQESLIQQSLWLKILTYGFLCFSIILLWAPKTLYNSKVWIYFFFMAVLLGAFSQTLTIFGVLFSFLFGLFCFIYPNPKYLLVYRIPAGLCVLALSFLLISHSLPGFNNWLILHNVQISEDAIPFTMYFNFDKTLVGLFILGFGHQLIHRKKAWLEMFKSLIPMILSILIIIMVLSYLFYYVHFDPKLPKSIFVWALANLFFVSTSEEAFFRGFIQKYLRKWLINFPYGKWLAVVLAAMIFGAIHYPGGIKYVVLASITGIAYGWVYERTQRIEASIITHFLLNLIHFLFFTYPALASAF